MAQQPVLPASSAEAMTESMEDARQSYANAVHDFVSEMENLRKINTKAWEAIVASGTGTDGLVGKFDTLKAKVASADRSQNQEAIEIMKAVYGKQKKLLTDQQRPSLEKSIEDAQKALGEFKKLSEMAKYTPGEAQIVGSGLNKIFIGDGQTMSQYSWGFPDALQTFKDMPGVGRFYEDMKILPPITAEEMSRVNDSLAGRIRFDMQVSRTIKALNMELKPTETINELINSQKMSNGQWLRLQQALGEYNLKKKAYEANKNQTSPVGLGSNNQNNAVPSTIRAGVTPKDAEKLNDLGASTPPGVRVK